MLEQTTCYLINGRWSLEVNPGGLTGTLKEHLSGYNTNDFKVVYWPSRNHLQASNYDCIPASILQTIKKQFKKLNGK